MYPKSTGQNGAQSADNSPKMDAIEGKYMKVLYTPWRKQYAKQVVGKQTETMAADCVFCQQVHQAQDEKHFIFRRYKHAYVVLNMYPYNAGHVMVLPIAHVASLDALSVPARAEIMELVSASTKIVREVLGAQAINVGINMGKEAGAGIPSHVHIHVLPRWQGDTNFLPVLFDTKTVSFDLREIYQKLKPAFEKLEI